MTLVVSMSRMPLVNAEPIPFSVRSAIVDGKVHEEEIEGLLATCLQHEMDHLEGILFIDHLSRLKRQMALKKLEKLRKAA